MAPPWLRHCFQVTVVGETADAAFSDLYGRYTFKVFKNVNYLQLWSGVLGRKETTFITLLFNNRMMHPLAHSLICIVVLPADIEQQEQQSYYSRVMEYV